MEKARFLSSLKLLLVYIAAVRAFSPAAKNEYGRVSRSALCSVQPSKNAGGKMPGRSDFLATVGSFVTGALVLSTEPAQASVATNPCKWVDVRRPE